MDYFKVKTKHVFHDGFNKTTLWTWIRLMALVAELEDMPSEKQMLAIITPNELKLIQNHFESQSKVLSNILEKVLEDVQEVKNKRELGKNRQRRYRENINTSRVTSRQCNEADKIREDKIREDKNTPLPPKQKKDIIQETLNQIQSPEWAELFKSWLEYKKEKKQQYSSSKSALIAYKHLNELSVSNIENAKKIIQQSIANNWSGLFPLKIQSGYKRESPIELANRMIREENNNQEVTIDVKQE